MRFTKLSIGILLALVIAVPFVRTDTASADSFYQNRIIDEAIFDNANSMSAAQIDAFLNSFPNSCISPNSGFRALDPNGYNPSQGYLYGGYTTAGQVIYDAGQAYGLNPQVLLATLQKEQSLVIGGASYCNDGDEHKYAAAVGYGCPDGGTKYYYNNVSLYQRNGVNHTSVGPTCVNSGSKAGFSQQVIRAAWLFKFGEQRSKGNVGWAVIKGAWNNSDDPQTCYGGPMTQGTYARCPSGGATYYDGYTTIDAIAVHMDNGATAALYWYTPHFHGNQNFFSLFTGWFGGALLPLAFKTPSNGSVYVQAGGYKFYVPTVNMLSDYGIGGGQIQTIPQASADLIPTPDGSTGLSTGLGNLVKTPSDSDADGGSVYLISYGKRYDVSYQQLTDFGFDLDKLAFIPLTYIYAIPWGGALSNFVQIPSTNAFQVSGGSKRVILEYNTYAALNTGGTVTPVSNDVANAIPSGLPIANSEQLISLPSGAIYLFSNNVYSYVPSSDVLSCWGFTSTMSMPLYRLSNDNIIPPISNPSQLGCSVAINSNLYVLNQSNKILVPGSYSFSAPSTSSDLATIANKIPTRNNSLGQAIQAVNNPTVWYLESGTKKGIPSLEDLRLLGISANTIDRVSPGAVNALSGAGIKFGVGQVVRLTDTGATYVITSASTKRWITTPETFSAYGYSWGAVMNFPSTAVNAYYTTEANPLSKYLYLPGGAAYLMDTTGCYGLTADHLAAYGQPASLAQSDQSYAYTIFPHVNLMNCTYASKYIKAVGDSTVYSLDSGTKHPVSTWTKLQTLSGQSNPYIISLSNSVIITFPTGTTL